MKKLYLITILGILSFNLMACGNKQSFMSFISGKKNTPQLESSLEDTFDTVMETEEETTVRAVETPVSVYNEIYKEDDSYDFTSLDYEKGSSIFKITNIKPLFLETKDDILPIYLANCHCDDLEGDYYVYLSYVDNLTIGDRFVASYSLGFDESLDKNIITNIRYIEKLEREEVEEEEAPKIKEEMEKEISEEETEATKSAKVSTKDNEDDSEKNEEEDGTPVLEDMLEADEEYTKDELEEMFNEVKQVDIILGDTFTDTVGAIKFKVLDEDTIYKFIGLDGDRYKFEIVKEDDEE
jgi:hypothetical protein